MSIKIKIFSDLVCPFCYVGTGIIDALKKDFDIEDIWIPHEIHPETPRQGQSITELFDPIDIEQVLHSCQQKGKPYGLEFGEIKTLSNTHLALEAAEFARDNGKYHQFHKAAFKAYFTHARDIGDMHVLLALAESCELNTQELRMALNEGRYTKRLEQGSSEARAKGVTAVPAFFIEDHPVITGVATEAQFREILQSKTNKLTPLNAPITDTVETSDNKEPQHIPTDDTKMKQSEIMVFFTGGTIGMSPTEGVHGVAPGGNFEKLLNQLAPQDEGVVLRPVPWSDKPSPHMTPQDMFRLAKEVEASLARPEVLGAVILHGTDVLAESAYLCDLVIDSDKPVILTGSMRYYSESGYDGVRNLINAVRAVLLPIPRGTGACVLMTDRIFAAREAVKVNSLNVDAFESREAGIVGYVAGETVILAGFPTPHAPRRKIRPQAIEPKVALITAYTGMDRSLIDHARETGNKGIVIEGFGAGNVPPNAVPALVQCLDEGIPVVLATRCIEGGVWPIYGYPGGGADLQDKGVILCGRLGGPKARIRLMCALGLTNDVNEIRDMFEDL